MSCFSIRTTRITNHSHRRYRRFVLRGMADAPPPHQPTWLCACRLRPARRTAWTHRSLPIPDPPAPKARPCNQLRSRRITQLANDPRGSTQTQVAHLETRITAPAPTITTFTPCRVYVRAGAAHDAGRASWRSLRLSSSYRLPTYAYKSSPTLYPRHFICQHHSETLRATARVPSPHSTAPAFTALIFPFSTPPHLTRQGELVLSGRQVFRVIANILANPCQCLLISDNALNKAD